MQPVVFGNGPAPVPIVSEKEAIVGKGVVLTIYEGGVKDVVFRVENDPRKFYINRGLESGLYLDELKKKLIEKNVIFKYPAY